MIDSELDAGRQSRDDPRVLTELSVRESCSGRTCWTRNSRVEEDLIDQLFNSERKAACTRLLLLLANFGKEGDPQLIMAGYQSETLAEIDRHDAVAGQSFHEQIQDVGLHHLSTAIWRSTARLLSVQL